MKRTAFLLVFVVLLVGAVNISVAQEPSQDEFPVDLYLDVQGQIVSIDEEAGTFILDNGVQVTMDFTALPPDISVAIGDNVTVSGILQEDGSILADIIIPDTTSLEFSAAALSDDGGGDTGGVVYGPGGSACDQAENCELVEDPGNDGELEVPEGVDTIVFKAGQNYVEIEIPEDGEEICVDGYCLSVDEDGNLSFYIEDGAKDISHIQLWDVVDDACSEDPEAEGCEDEGTGDDICAENPEAEGCEDEGTGDDICAENPEAEGCEDEGTGDDACAEDPDAEGCEEDTGSSCGYSGDEGGETTESTDDGCHPVLVIFSEAFEVPYDELNALFTEEHYGIGEIGRVYLLANAAGVDDVSEITDMRDSGMGWGQIMKEYPDVHPSQLAPGSVIGNGRGHSVRNGDDGGGETTATTTSGGGSPGNSGNAPGHNNGGGGSPGNSGNAPGHNNNNGGSPGNSGNAPGHNK